MLHNGNLLEVQLLASLKDNNQEAFSILFKTYYKDLVLFGGNFIKNKTVCEDIVQSIFLHMWENRRDLTIRTSLKSYLLQSVRNNCLDELRHKKVVDNYTTHYMNEDKTDNYVLYSDLQEHVQEAIEKLPEKYKETFLLSRTKNLKYREISELLNVSVRTVEERISRALALLRISLKDHLDVVLVILFFIFF